MLETQITINEVAVAALLAGSAITVIAYAVYASGVIERRDGKSPLWFLMGMLSILAAVAWAAFSGAAPAVLEATANIAVFVFLGAGWAYYLMRWLVGRRRRRA